MNTKIISIQRVQTVNVLFILSVSMLLFADVQVAGMPLQRLLNFGLVALQAFLTIIMMRKIYSGRTIVDFIVLVLLVWEVINLLIKLLQTTSEGAIDYGFQVVMITLALFYFSLREASVYKEWYLDLLLYFSLVIMAVLLYSYFTATEYSGLLSGIKMEKQEAASYLLIPCMISSYQYCICRDRAKSRFYLLTAAVSFLMLFLNQNIVSFWMMAVVLLVIPLILRTTAAIVKKQMQILFLYLFMLSNMSLLNNYTDFIKKEAAYGLEQSIYLDLLMVIVGLYFFEQWDKIPEGIDLERLVLRKLRRGYKLALKILGIIFTGSILGGEHWKKLSDGISVNIIKGFAEPLAEEVRMQKSAFVLCMEKDPLAGILIFALFGLLIRGVKKNHSYGKQITGCFILFFIVFVVQLLFWIPSENTLLIYLMMTVLAGTYREDIRNVTSVKIKFEKERALKDESFTEECI